MINTAPRQMLEGTRAFAGRYQQWVRNLAAGSSEVPELTSKRYNVKRGDYAIIQEEHRSYFKSLLGETRVISDPAECESYNVDWLKMVRGSSSLVLKPKTTDEVSSIMRYCNQERLAVCPQSGNTGLSGGSVPVFDEIVLSLQLMNNIASTDPLTGVIVCEAGCVLGRLEAHLNALGLMMPLDLGAKDSCMIGGCVSTNAGGIRLVRYGNLHGNTLGLEAVLADGEVVDCLNTMVKDNSGYHLKHLFIGSEGTLGIVTKVAIKCPPLPKAINVAFLGLKDYESVVGLFGLAKRELAEILSSCELMDRTSVQVCERELKLRSPLSGSHEFYILVETSGSDMSHDEAKIARFLEKAMDLGLVEDGTLASEPSKIKSIWELRERMAEAHTRTGYLYKYDLSLPLPHFYKIVEVLRDRLKDTEASYVDGFGHFGDGNIHLQVSSPGFSPRLLAQIEPFVYEYVGEAGGSVSSEHGIGFKKAQFVRFSQAGSAIALMRRQKRWLDPLAILNPYKVIHPL